MRTQALRTPEFCSGDSLTEFVARAVAGVDLKDGILAITSKIVALAEGRTVPRVRDEKGSKKQKAALVEAEAERVFGKSETYDVWLTLKHGILIPSAGIDESNSRDGSMILFPQDPWKSARELWLALKPTVGSDRFGVIITDSHTTPLRRGVTGIALTCYGFRPVRSLIGVADLFERPLQYTTVNVADAVAAAAVFEMGEAAERRPLCVISDLSLEFTHEDVRHDIVIPPEQDLYSCLFS